MLAGLAAAIVLSVTPVSAQDANSPGSERVLPVAALKVSKSSFYEVTEQYVGRVVTRRSSDLGFQNSGLLKTVLVEEGERVEEGDLLAELDTSRFEGRRRELLAELTQNRASLEETRARLEFAEVTTKRRESLLKTDNVSRQLFDEARFDVQALKSAARAHRASVERVAQAVKIVEIDIENSKIYAPYSGTIVSRKADEGTALEAGRPVFTLIEDNVKEVRIGLPTSTAGRLIAGKLYNIKVHGVEHEALLRSVLTMVDTQTRTVPAIFEIAEPESARSIRSGELARIEIDIRIEDEGFWLPIDALIGGRRGLWNAMALEPAAEAEGLYRVSRREVQVLHSETERAYVRGAMSDGDIVVASGLHRVVPGQIVRLVDSPAVN
jgi:RND family efflux transporter MFP subunit